MGGNALTIKTRRYSKQEYQEAVHQITPLLPRMVKKYFVPPSYESKETFGDLDILVVPKSNQRDLVAAVRFHLNPEEIKTNPNAIHFNHGELQVDLILVPEQEFEIASIYYSFNDFGNFTGRLFKSFGVNGLFSKEIKFGGDGLTYTIYNSTYDKKFERVLLSRDPSEIFSFVGLSYGRYKEGFKTLEDIFDFIMASPYFNSRSYSGIVGNNHERGRDRKRPNMIRFYEYTQEKEHTNFESDFSQEEVIDLLEKKFPNSKLKEKIAHYKEIEDKQKEAKEKFNVDLIRETLGIADEQLQVMMKNFAKSFNSASDRTEFIRTHTQEQIFEHFLKL